MKALAILMKTIGIIVLVLMILIGLLSFVPRLIGWETASIVSGSMTPEIPIGSMVFAGKTDCTTLETGDIIMYQSGNTPITHRVVLNDVENEQIHTKGDANAQEDMYPVAYRQVMGKVNFHLPVMGSVLLFFSPLLGKICGLIILGAGVALILGGSYIARRKSTHQADH